MMRSAAWRNIPMVMGSSTKYPSSREKGRIVATSITTSLPIVSRSAWPKRASLWIYKESDMGGGRGKLGVSRASLWIYKESDMGGGRGKLGVSRASLWIYIQIWEEAGRC